MLLVHLVSKVQIDTLCDSVAVPGNATFIAIKGFTDTGGIHLTKVNLNVSQHQKYLVFWVPFINLVKSKLNCQEVGIHNFKPRAARNVDRNTHVVAS